MFRKIYLRNFLSLLFVYISFSVFGFFFNLIFNTDQTSITQLFLIYFFGLVFYGFIFWVPFLILMLLLDYLVIKIENIPTATKIIYQTGIIVALITGTIFYYSGELKLLLFLLIGLLTGQFLKYKVACRNQSAT